MTGSSPLGHKTRLLLFWALAALSTLLLSISLMDVNLEPGRRFGIQSPAGAAAVAEAPASSTGPLRILRIVSLCCAVLFVISLIVHLASREGRRKLLADLILIVLFVLASAFLLNLRTPDAPPRGKEAAGETGDSGGLPVYSPPDAVPPFNDNPPPWAGWVMTAGFSLAAAALTAGILLAALRRRGHGGAMARELAETADVALGSLRAGADTRNAVIRCYAAMSRIVARDRGIRRGADMTPSEFVEVLTGVGIPEPPVRSLTRVFEDVRYGRAAPTEESGRQALDALERIAAACRGADG